MKTSKKIETREAWFQDTISFLQELKLELNGKKIENKKGLSKKLDNLLANYDTLSMEDAPKMYYDEHWNERSDDKLTYHDLSAI